MQFQLIEEMDENHGKCIVKVNRILYSLGCENLPKLYPIKYRLCGSDLIVRHSICLFKALQTHVVAPNQVILNPTVERLFFGALASASKERGKVILGMVPTYQIIP